MDYAQQFKWAGTVYWNSEMCHCSTVPQLTDKEKKRNTDHSYTVPSVALYKRPLDPAIWKEHEPWIEPWPRLIGRE